MSASVGDDVLIMFSKAPVAGKVKTRLVPDIGPRAAADLQEAFIGDLGERLTRLNCKCVLACSPSTSHPVFEALANKGWERWEQGVGDLGERLERALKRAFKAGARRVVIIGSDSPTLPAQLVERAFVKLARFEAVVGPVFDGGYYLIGAGAPTSLPFDDIPWGSADVFRATVSKLDEAGVSYAILPFWYDVDDFATLQQLAAHLGLSGPYGRFEAPRTERVLGEIGM